MAVQPELIFVYNADSGTFNAVKDSLHKWLRPESYDCALCGLTHNLLGEAKQWTRFRKQFAGNLHFYHKDEFIKEFASKWLPKYQFPVVLIKDQDGLEIFMNAQELASLDNVTALITAIKARLPVA